MLNYAALCPCACVVDRRMGMKTFSVAFFKRLILVILALLILIPTALAIIFGVRYSNLKKRMDQLEEISLALPDSTILPL